jgi:hypothetical protein
MREASELEVDELIRRVAELLKQQYGVMVTYDQTGLDIYWTNNGINKEPMHARLAWDRI